MAKVAQELTTGGRKKKNQAEWAYETVKPKQKDTTQSKENLANAVREVRARSSGPNTSTSPRPKRVVGNARGEFGSNTSARAARADGDRYIRNTSTGISYGPYANGRTDAERVVKNNTLEIKKKRSDNIRKQFENAFKKK